MSKIGFYILISIIAVAGFFGSNHLLRGYLRCQECLGKEIQSPKDSLYQYNLVQKAPFKYRVLFTSIVKSSFKIAFNEFDSEGFYFTYTFWSLVFFITSACSLFYLLQTCGFSNSYSLLGSISFLLLPPILMAYTVPVHTREDPLAYTLLFSGLIFLINKRPVLFLIVSIVGALCRETLLLLPLLYFFFSNDLLIWRRFLIPGIPGLVWLSLRFFMEPTSYDVLEGFHWNIDNPEQVVGFLFITFNLFWLPFLFQVIFNRKSFYLEAHPNRVLFLKSSWVTVGVILVTTYFGGIYNEIRLLYLLAPWILILSLDFFEKNGAQAFKFMKSWFYLLYIVAILLLSIALLYFVMTHQQSLLKPGRYNIPYHLWIIISVIYIFLTLVVTPALLKTFYKLKSR